MKLIACVLALAGMAVGQSKSTGTCSNLDGGPEWAPRADGVCYQADKPVVPPRSVPAVHHSSIPVDNWRDCPSDHFIASGTATIGRAKYSCVPVKEWTCADPFRALIVSQNGKKAACLLVESE